MKTVLKPNETGRFDPFHVYDLSWTGYDWYKNWEKLAHRDYHGKRNHEPLDYTFLNTGYRNVD